MKKYLLLLSLAVGSMTANAEAPKRPMLEQGKTWTYIYHHFEVAPTGSESDVVPGREGWPVEYTLKGDTVIDGRQYMKMYRFDIANYKTEYYAAYREDEEGRVYVTDDRGRRDFKLIDFNDPLPVLDNDYPMPYNDPGSAFTETIKANGNLFTRYRYTNSNTVGIEGVGYQKYGLLTFAFYTIPPLTNHFEELYSVSTQDFTFYASDFDAPKEIELAEGERKLIESNNDFAFNLFRKARIDTSCVLSPLSITYALGMLNNGADGQTLKEINQTLGFGEAGADAINAFCQKMLKEANTLDPGTKALIANTIFVNEGLGYRLQEGFIDKANTYYSAQPQNRDFADGETMDVINQWANDHTEGMIPEVLNEDTFKPRAVSYLLNALYFKGMWSSPFKKEMTTNESFGGGKEVPMMHKMGQDFQYAENDLYQAIRLPYGNGAYDMTVFLPREGKTIGDVLDTLNGSNWQFDSLPTEVDLKLPRFETDTNQNLVKTMSDLGMPTAFEEYADFPHFCNVPVFISNMFQVAKIKLDEEGTEAAAVTVIQMDWEAMPDEPKRFHANRPFLYIISEQSTGAIFFIGQYTGGVTADVKSGIVGTKSESKTASNHQIYNLSGQRLSKEPAHGLYIKNGKVMIK
jgi:serpin B